MTKKELEAMLENSEQSKKEMFTHFNNRIAELKKEIENAKKGAMQLNDALNSILIGAAIDHDGLIKVPKNHMELLKLWEYEVKDNGTEYVFVIKPKLSEDDLPFEKG